MASLLGRSSVLRHRTTAPRPDVGRPLLVAPFRAPGPCLRDSTLPCKLHLRLPPAEAQSGSRDSTRKVRLSRSRHAAALEVLRRVTFQATLPVPSEPPEAGEGLFLRFPALEFRSLLLNAIGRDSFPDRAVWKRNKVELCSLLLHLASGDTAAYGTALEAVVAACISLKAGGGGGAGTGSSGGGSSRGDKGVTRRQRARAAAAAAAAALAVEEGSRAAAAAGSSSSSSSSLASAGPSPPDASAATSSLSSCSSLDGADGADGLPLPATASSAASTSAPSCSEAAAAVAAALFTVTHKRTLESRRAALRSQIDGWCRAIVDGAAALTAAQAGGGGAGSTAGGTGTTTTAQGCSGTPAPPTSCSSGTTSSTSTSSTSSRGPRSPPCTASLASAAAAFVQLRPLLERVLGLGEPAPLVDIRRNGSYTELQVAAQLEGHLPPGWRLYAQATIVRVDGAPFVNRKHLKGEADLLLVDPDGVVQALVEVKTAKGNPYVALYEDVGKLLGLLRAVRNRVVTFRHGGASSASNHSSSNSSSGSSSPELVTLAFSKRLRPIYVLGCGGPTLGGLEWQPASAASVAAAASAPAAWSAAAMGGAGGGAGAGAGAAAAATTIKGSYDHSIAAAAAAAATSTASATAAAAAAGNGSSSGGGGGLVVPPSAVLRSAWSKLLTMELGRELSGGGSSSSSSSSSSSGSGSTSSSGSSSSGASCGPAAVWSSVSVAALTREAVVLQLPPAAVPRLAARVSHYFSRLAHCEVYLVNTA
ncbi:hypothetical protein HYH02_014764 [Chlamydomonas schloesseri]|uniref:Uncharacterized protein n=1 Tax=Chlamydomonas schloesseri TaxID=2026947 RepID=A0A835SR35_9CHLO|nr:hypothetical protein HYH02_014764 [Chlamydomonas schloesseri]|eukprot:KAG2426724.1 hypothetical protein HYH02_014764 [Chlamydomonas schloesseri]